MISFDKKVIFIPDPVLFRDFKQSPTGPVGKDLIKRGEKLIRLAQRSVKKRSGTLAASIHMTYYPTRNPKIIVGSDKKYAYYVHEGTHPHLIVPEHGRVLRFKVKGKIVYAQKVVHPGSRPTHFLSRHLRTIVR